MYDEANWGSTMDWLVTLMTVPSLLLLGFLLMSESGADESPLERTEILAAASLLLVISIFICCYISKRLNLTCCICMHNDQSLLLAPWNKNKDISPPPTYDTLPIYLPPSNSTRSNDGLEVVIEVTGQLEPGIHTWSQRASMEQQCYQNLRPQEDNG